VTPPKARLFVALDLPGPVRDRLHRWGRAQLGGRDALRAIRRDDLHVTLCFLGWREEADVAHLGGIVRSCAVPVPELSLGDPVWLPPRRPRVVAVDVADGAGALSALQAALSAALADRGGYEPEARAYRPHVTVVRVRSGARVPARDRSGLEPPDGGGFSGAALTLYRSRLSAAGARYEPAQRVEL
jgi:2'-5' RNA ligase